MCETLKSGVLTTNDENLSGVVWTLCYMSEIG